MADPNDVAGTKLARKEFGRHCFDTTSADIRVSHGVVYVRGILKKMKSATFADAQEETQKVARILRLRPMIRDVVVDVTYR